MRSKIAGLTVVLVGLASTASVSAAETTVERGQYLVTTIGACGNCHTPRQGELIGGTIIPGTELSGGAELDEDIGHLSMPNITPDMDTGIGQWTNAQVVTALRDGRRPDGKIIGPPMPIAMYQNLSDNDASAIATYLLTMKPVNHPVPRSVYKISLPDNYGPPVTHVDALSPTDKVAYGGYLATFGHCVVCHTPAGKDQPLDRGLCRWPQDAEWVGQPQHYV